MNTTGYVQGSGGGSGPASYDSADADHSRLKRQYLNYLDNKTEEIKEQKDARRYYHGAQYTAEQIKVFKDRRQPVVTYNRIGRKINAVVGLLERQRQDPRGFPRTPKHEQGAEVATAVLRFVLDKQEWATVISPNAGLNAAVDGIGAIELVLETRKDGDLDVALEEVDPASFFYDPRSLKPDFSDARYMGVGKWADLDTAIEMFPEHEEALRASCDGDSDLSSNPDYEEKWFTGTEDNRKIRLVDHWYIENGEWRWCIYTGSVLLDQGVSPFVDEDGDTFCKFLAFSANVDHEGDRYGFVRNMRSSQDEINQRRSKGLHLLNSRRIIIEKGSVDDVEKFRKEAARPDGVMEVNPGMTVPQFDEAAKAAELNGHLGFLEDAKAEIENYGFNPALIGQGVDKMSGRAMQIQQQAGIAELGPYLLSFKGWKLRVYRAIWNTLQRYWKAERWIRVTDDEGLAQFFAVNQLEVDPMTGMPTIVNALGELDVDIIIDEGPDTINMQQDAYDTLTVMARSGQQVPPEVLIELSTVQGSVKKKVLGQLEKAKKEAAQMRGPAMQLEMQGRQAEIKETESRAMLNVAKAQSEGMPQPGQPQTGLEADQAFAEIQDKAAATQVKMAQAEKLRTETRLMPMEFMQDQRETQMARQERFAMKRADLNRPAE